MLGELSPDIMGTDPKYIPIIKKMGGYGHRVQNDNVETPTLIGPLGCM